MPYLGVEDDLWRASKTIDDARYVVYTSYNFLKGGLCLERQGVDVCSRYTDKPVLGGVGYGAPLDKPLMDATLFRNAAFQSGIICIDGFAINRHWEREHANANVRAWNGGAVSVRAHGGGMNSDGGCSPVCLFVCLFTYVQYMVVCLLMEFLPF